MMHICMLLGAESLIVGMHIKVCLGISPFFVFSLSGWLESGGLNAFTLLAGSQASAEGSGLSEGDSLLPTRCADFSNVDRAVLPIFHQLWRCGCLCQWPTYRQCRPIDG